METIIDIGKDINRIAPSIEFLFDEDITLIFRDSFVKASKEPVN